MLFIRSSYQSFETKVFSNKTQAERTDRSEMEDLFDGSGGLGLVFLVLLGTRSHVGCPPLSRLLIRCFDDSAVGACQTAVCLRAKKLLLLNPNQSKRLYCLMMT